MNVCVVECSSVAYYSCNFYTDAKRGPMETEMVNMLKIVENFVNRKSTKCVCRAALKNTKTRKFEELSNT